MVQFPTHHTHTGMHIRFAVDGITQFFQRSIRLFSHERADDRGAGGQSAGRPSGGATRRKVVRFTPTPPPILNRAQTDLKMLGDLRLRILALFKQGDDPFAKI
jgi:hypothetical protein